MLVALYLVDTCLDFMHKSKFPGLTFDVPFLSVSNICLEFLKYNPVLCYTSVMLIVVDGTTWTLLEHGLQSLSAGTAGP